VRAQQRSERARACARARVRVGSAHSRVFALRARKRTLPRTRAAPHRLASPRLASPRPAPPPSLAARVDLLFPCIVVARLWRERPFSRPLAPGVDLALKAAASVVFASFAAAGVAWYFTCESETRGDVIDARCPKCKD
jgi:hypothetical protein